MAPNHAVLRSLSDDGGARLPIWFRIDRSRQLLLARAESSLSRREFEDSLQEAVAHPDFSPGFRQLCDFRELHEFGGGYDEYHEVIENGRKFSDRLQGGRVALVAERDSVFGMLRMYQAIAQELPLEISVFRDMEEAERWLEL